MVLDLPLQEDPENHSRVLDVVVVGGIAENEISGLVQAAILSYVGLMPNILKTRGNQSCLGLYAWCESTLQLSNAIVCTKIFINVIIMRR